jgi:hypothetical protein
MRMRLFQSLAYGILAAAVLTPLPALAKHHRGAAAGSGGIAQALERAVESDSQDWLMNRFDTGSVTGVEVVEKLDDGSEKIRGNYTFNGGQSGWVQAIYANGRTACLEFWDRQGNCAGVRGDGRSHAAPRDEAAASTGGAWERLSQNIDEIRIVPESDASCLMEKRFDQGGETRVYSNNYGDTGSVGDRGVTILLKSTCGRPVHMQFPGFLGSANDIDIRKGDLFSLDCNTHTTMGSGMLALPHSNEACSGGHFIKRVAQ